MKEANRLAYLEALEIPVWISKEYAGTPAARPRALLRTGPGNGQVLLVCNAQGESASRIAADVSRSLGSEPVWAWPEPGDDGQALEEAVADRLLTSVVIFGKDLAASLLGPGEVTGAVGTARIERAPGFEELAREPEARKALWAMFRAGGLNRS